MKYIEKINVKLALTLLFFIAVWAFWSLANGGVLTYQEETQLFLFDSEMFMERIIVPAGIARYIGEFFVQMYNIVWLGGLIVAVFYTCLQLLTWQLVKKECKTELLGYALSFVPVLLLWFYMGDIKIKMTFVVALIIAELAMLAADALRPEPNDDKAKKVVYILYLLVVTPLLAWVAGPTVLVFGLYVALLGIKKPYDFVSILAVVYAPVCILISYAWAVAPLYRLFYGIHYSMVVDQFPTVQYIVMLAFAIMPFIVSKIPAFKNEKKETMAGRIAVVVIAVVAAVFIPTSRNPLEIEIVSYDRLVRAQQWDDIITKADRKTPDAPLTVTQLNLALAMKGELLSRGFDYYQNGWAGAFPKFNKFFEVSIITAETYYYLGLINAAQRLCFEANETLPDNAKSVRCVKRLAETNLINGQYDVARRYLKILEKTMFYKGWAERKEAMLGNEKAINSHPLYGYLRKLRLGVNKFVFSEDEIDKMCGQLLMHNPDNVVAMQYLLFLPQLEKNQRKYNAYMDFVQKNCKNSLSPQ